MCVCERERLNMCWGCFGFPWMNEYTWKSAAVSHWTVMSCYRRDVGKPSSWIYHNVFHGRSWRDTLIREIGASFNALSCQSKATFDIERERLGNQTYFWEQAQKCSGCASKHRRDTLTLPPGCRWAQVRPCQVHSSSSNRGLYRFVHPKSKTCLGCWILVWWTHLSTSRKNITLLECQISHFFQTTMWGWMQRQLNQHFNILYVLQRETCSIWRPRCYWCTQETITILNVSHLS